MSTTSATNPSPSPPKTSKAQRRVVKAAMRCFATKGYAATTIADIEREAGLAVGAGGTYRHFPTKQAMLAAVVDAIVDVPDGELVPPGNDIRQDAHNSLAYMNADLTRLFIRGLDDFPEQRAKIVDRSVTGPYRIVAERIASVNENVDAEATAAVILGSLIYFRVLEVLIGEGASGVSQDRFVDAWASLYETVLGIEAAQ